MPSRLYFVAATALLLAGCDAPAPVPAPVATFESPDEALRYLEAQANPTVDQFRRREELQKGPVGRLVASVLFGLAEIETEYRRERQAAGIAEAKKRGVYRGRDRGTTKAPARRARELRGRGLTVQETATALGVSRRTAFRYLAESPAS